MAASEHDPRTDAPRMRITLKYADLPTFIERFGKNITRAGFFVPCRAPAAVGSRLRFELLLADGKTLLMSGDGIVAWIRPPAPGQARAPLLGLRFARLDDASRPLLEQVLASRQVQASRDDAASGPPPELERARLVAQATLGEVGPAELDRLIAELPSPADDILQVARALASSTDDGQSRMQAATAAASTAPARADDDLPVTASQLLAAVDLGMEPPQAMASGSTPTAPGTAPEEAPGPRSAS